MVVLLQLLDNNVEKIQKIIFIEIFGMAHPEGYRKALRLMKQAEKFNRPIFTFIDTKVHILVKLRKNVDKVNLSQQI